MALSRVRRTEAGHAVDTGPVERGAHRHGLARLGHDGEHGGRPEQRGDGGREREARHGVDVGEVALVHLLEPAVPVELDHLHVEGVVEVGDGRVVEGEMAVLPDAEAAQVEGVGLEQSPA